MKAFILSVRLYLCSLLAAEISRCARYMTRMVQFAPRAEDDGLLRSQILSKESLVIRTHEELSAQTLEDAFVLINGNFNYEFNIQAELSKLKTKLPRSVRLGLVLYSPYARWLYAILNRLGLWHGASPWTFITRTDLLNLAELSGFRVVRLRPVGYFPWRLYGLGDLLNWILPAMPFVRHFSLATVALLRPINHASTNPSASVIIPARNEKGNIQDALRRIPTFAGEFPEIIFVEGHSTDGTYEEILRVTEQYRQKMPIKVMKQNGSGKADAVRLGFSQASSEVVMVLDADLTMPPELLPQFYEAYNQGFADVINGSRLVYPSEGNEMKFLNLLGNVFFAKALSHLLELRIGDSLCGTKLISKREYARGVAWREDFGSFDPFGDFEVLFSAAILGMGVIDVPVSYRARVYGTTNIRRFFHGWMLLKMTLVGFFRIRCGASSPLPRGAE